MVQRSFSSVLMGFFFTGPAFQGKGDGGIQGQAVLQGLVTERPDAEQGNPLAREIVLADESHRAFREESGV